MLGFVEKPKDLVISDDIGIGKYYISIEDYDIPKVLDAYDNSLEITVPNGNYNGKFDECGYHFFSV